MHECEFQFQDDFFDDCIETEIVISQNINLKPKDKLWFIDNDSTNDDYENSVRYQMNYFFITKCYEKSFSKAKELFDLLAANNSVEKRNSLECMLYSAIQLKRFDVCDELLADLSSLIMIPDHLISYLVICEELFIAANNFSKLISVYKALVLLMPMNTQFWFKLKELGNHECLLDLFSEEESNLISLYFHVSMASAEGNKANDNFVAMVLSEVSTEVARLISLDHQDVRFIRFDDTSGIDSLFHKLYFQRP